MAINAAGVAPVSNNQILFNDLQEVLKNSSVLKPLITDYTSKIEVGDISFDIPRLSGGSATNRKDDGTAHADGDMTIAIDKVLLNQHKIVPQYIYDLARQSTKTDLDMAFLELAPSSLADLIEQAIYAQIKLASAAAPDHIIQFSGAGNLVPTIADFYSAAQVLDEAKVPVSDRYCAMTPLMYNSVIQLAEIQAASNYMSNEAVVKGQFSEIAGFKLVKTNNATAGEIVFWHKTAVGFGMAKSVEFEKQREAKYERDFLSLKTSYGMKVLDLGKRSVLFNATGA
ncbi:MAG: phage capsid protein [Candidatus Peregrinibacteria bacterium]|nr:phage capsid protein [Candidatus Peregrinibacteria bacterium]